MATSRNVTREQAAAHTLKAAAIVGIAFGILSCSSDTPDISPLVLPATPVLSLEVNWAVITSSHLRLREQPAVSAQVVTTLWRGYVLEVLSKQDRREEIEGSSDYWYQVRFGGLQGWVFGSYLNFYTSNEAAAAAGDNLRS